jgi:hypothetical protein
MRIGGNRVANKLRKIACFFHWHDIYYEVDESGRKHKKCIDCDRTLD